MDSGGAFPNWSSSQSSPSYIQIIGPESGNCSDILRSICEYTREHSYDNTQALPLQSTASVKNIEAAIGTIFIFFNTDQSNLSSATSLNNYVVSGLSYWLDKYEREDNTVLIFEGDVSNRISLPIDVELTEQTVEQDDIQEMKKTVLTSCIEFESNHKNDW